MSVGKKLRERARVGRTQRRNFLRNLELLNLLTLCMSVTNGFPVDEVKVRISNFFGVSVQELFFNLNRAHIVFNGSKHHE